MVSSNVIKEICMRTKVVCCESNIKTNVKLLQQESEDTRSKDKHSLILSISFYIKM